MLLRKLTEACGAPGQEGEVRALIRSEIEGYVDEIRTDALGNLIAVKNPSAPGPKVMLAAHMDEVALMILGIEKNGLLRFRPIGGIDPRVLVAKTVLVGEKKVPGVIGSKPIHLQRPEERQRPLSIDELAIDIGAKSQEEAEKVVNLGDCAYFATKFEEFGQDKIKAKALDDRVGCALLIELLKQNYDIPVYGVFTVQEEVGLRGAGVAAYQIQPDVAIVLEGTTASDVPGSDPHKHATSVGKGPAITIMDRTVITHPPLVRRLIELAEEHNIPYQIRRTNTGGTDAGQIQLTAGGTKAAVIAVPCRYIHSAASVMSKKDYEAAFRLTSVYLQDLQEREGN
ncbi:MAG: M42 family metallopeptidase [Firmicutes bacterium]|nr:M42 family metallopeptidase [Bacillota bacterium]